MTRLNPKTVVRKRHLLVPLAIVALVSTLAGGATYAAFRADTANSGNSFAAAPDYEPPTIVRSVIKKTTGYSADRVKQAGVYQVYAQVTDGGNPASGVNTVTANVAVAGNVITTGQTAVPLVAGSYTVEGTTYNYRSANLTVTNPTAAGVKNYTITGTDNNAQSSGAQTFTVTVDNTVPTASAIDTANGGSIVGRPEQNDTITYTFSEAMDPDSIYTGWTGSATNVVVRFDNATTNGCTSAADNVEIWDPTNTTRLNIGCVRFTGNFVAGDRTFGATGTPSSMVMSGSAVTVTLGTQSGAGRTSTASQTTTWVPFNTAYDEAGNAMSTTVRTQVEVAW